MQLKNDIRYRPFLSFTTLRIFALIIFGITQIVMAVYIFAYVFVIPVEELTSDNVSNIFDLFIELFASGEITSTISEYKLLIEFWPVVKGIYNISRLVSPLLIIGLFARLIQNPKKIKIVFFRYLFMTILVFLAEIGFFYMFFEPILGDIGSNHEINPVLIELATTLIKTFMITSANLNIFLDMLIAVIFFKFFMALPKSKFFKRHLKVYRSISILPVIYIIFSTIIIGLEKNGSFTMPLFFNSLLSARGIYVYVLFYSMCLYFKYRFPNMRSSGNYIKSLNESNLEVFNFTAFICLMLLVLTVIGRICVNFPTLVTFRFDVSSSYFYLIPLILFYNYTIKARFKLLHILYGLYYFVIFIFLITIYGIVLDYVIKLFEIISKSL